MKTITPCKNPLAIRNHLETLLNQYYGGDTFMAEKFAMETDYEVELEFKKVFKLMDRKVSYFGA